MKNQNLKSNQSLNHKTENSVQELGGSGDITQKIIFVLRLEYVNRISIGKRFEKLIEESLDNQRET